MKLSQAQIVVFLFLAALIGVVIFYNSSQNNAPETVFIDPLESSLEYSIDDSIEASIFSPPLSDQENRVVKKPFGIWITPETSPIQPERFRGFHTGTDFEIFPDELNVRVPVSAICEGRIIFKKWVAGYGGVMVQSCQLKNQPVTVIYGHLNLAESSAKLNQKIKAGQEIAILADHESSDSDGERKHLHLGIHKGSRLDLQGYVDSQKELNNWINFKELFPKK